MRVFRTMTSMFFAACLLATPHGFAQAPAIPPLSGGEFHLFTSLNLQTPGLTGRYFNTVLNLSQGYDWKALYPSATRTDPTVDFVSNGWGNRAPLGLTGGSNANWDNFSVQWDGYVQVVTGGLSLAIVSDRPSRVLIDRNGNSMFGDPGDTEIVNTGFRRTSLSPMSTPISAGVYKVRIQYSETNDINIMRLISPGAPTVRIAYVMPTDRSPQPNAIANLRNMVLRGRAWYAEQMERHGFGNLTFRYERDVDGVTPRIHTLYVDEIAEDLHPILYPPPQVRSSYFVGNAVAETGAPVCNLFNFSGVNYMRYPGELWILVPEIHVQSEEGLIIADAIEEAGWIEPRQARDPATAIVGSARLAFTDDVHFLDNTPYHGLIIPSIGPYPLINSGSYHSFLSGDTISAVVSAYQGVFLHEMTHALGFTHDHRNELGQPNTKFNGNVMGFGSGGFRGAYLPTLYPQDDTRLTYRVALAVRNSPYFEPIDNPQAPALTYDALGPVVSGISTSIVSGVVQVQFTAEDPNGLSAAILMQGNDPMDEMPLSGMIATANLYANNPSTAALSLIVYDLAGNWTQQSVGSFTQPSNHAPKPSFRITPSHARANQLLTLDWSATTDAESNNPLTMSWDLNQDGNYEFADTGPGTVSLFLGRGNRLFRIRVTDANGNVATSAPIALRIECAADWNLDGAVNEQDDEDFEDDYSLGNADFNSDGVTDEYDDIEYYMARELACP